MKRIRPLLASFVVIATGSVAACGGSDSGLFEGEGGASSEDASTDAHGGSAGAKPDAAAGGASGKAGAAGSAGAPSAGGSAGSAGSPATGGGAGTAGSPANGGAAGTGGAAGGCGSCDDGVACTVDSCPSGSCIHTPDASLCGAGMICDPLQGCVASLVCASLDDCTKKFGGDPCKANLHCDGATATCVWDPLDKDGDKGAPAVCGGTDCNDADPSIWKGAPELCDGKDNDCDSGIDDGATCPGLLQCMGGQCACPAANACGSECVDKTLDPKHCGACFKVCPAGAACVSGACKCVSGLLECSGQCVDTATNASHCGGCGLPCGAGQACVAGKCVCPGNVPVCNGQCPDYANDPNHCGACGHACPAGQSCSQGTCKACAPADLVILLDHSGSMSVNLGADTRWNATRSATKAFLAEPASASIGAGLQFMPVPTGPVPCSTTTDCTVYDFFATCVNGFCQFTYYNADSCVVSDYAKPKVPIAPLSQPGQISAIGGAIDAQLAEGGTPMTPALEGTLQYAKSKAVGSGHRVAVVLMTDGIPNTCTGVDTTAAAASVAQTYSSGSPKIPTYVIGIGTVGDADWQPTDWNQIAAAGGTGAFLPATSTAEIQQRLDAIRNAFAVCP